MKKLEIFEISQSKSSNLFIINELRKAITTKSRMRKTFLKGKTKVFYLRLKFLQKMESLNSNYKTHRLYTFKGESHIDFHTHCAIMALNDRGRGWRWGGRRAITNEALKFRKIVEFQCWWIVMNCQWIAYSYTKSAQFMSGCIPYIQVNSLKIIPL